MRAIIEASEGWSLGPRRIFRQKLGRGPSKRPRFGGSPIIDRAQPRAWRGTACGKRSGMELCPPNLVEPGIGLVDGGDESVGAAAFQLFHRALRNFDGALGRPALSHRIATSARLSEPPSAHAFAAESHLARSADV